MLKKQISLGGLFLALSINAQTAEHAFQVLNTDIKGYFYVSSDWGDYDKDGDLDFIVSGGVDTTEDGYADAAKIEIYQNNNGSFQPVLDTDEVKPLYLGTVKFVDVDTDGDLDIVLTGLFEQMEEEHYLYVYENENGKYSLKQTMMGTSYSSLDFGDYDNDGDLDMLITGASKSYSNLITKLYKNNNGTYSETDIYFEAVQNGDAKFMDVDNDQDLDILLMGKNASYSSVLRVYENVNNEFSNKQELEGVHAGSLAIADYDADGDLDFATMGKTDDFKSIAKIYENNKGSFQEAESLLGTSSYTGSEHIAWGDYDNDGDYDVIFSGTNSNYKDDTELYKNTGTGFELVDEGVFHSGANSCVNWADIDQDNDLDLFTSGYAYGDNYQLVGHNNLHLNNTEERNQKPEAPSNLTASEDSDKNVTFSWDLANDDKTPAKGLHYILNIGTSEGTSDIASYKVYGTKWEIKKLGLINFHWSVQAVDASFVASNPAIGNALSLDKIQIKNSEFAIYPNPVNDYMQLKNNANIQIQSLVIYDMAMNKIAQMKVNSKDKINVNFLNKGMYILQFKTNDATIVRKLIKQ